MKPSHPNGRVVGWQQSMNLITREIGIDMGHRVTNHGSKCRNMHGHRYRVEAVLEGRLFTAGEQEGMVLDFGFLKELMLDEIDRPCDHGMCLWVKDPLLDAFSMGLKLSIEEIRARVGEYDYLETEWMGGKLYVLGVVPTAENLAKHWFERLAPHVDRLTQSKARLFAVRVWETPNCMAEYQA